MSALTIPQRKALALLPKFTAFGSIVGSVFIVLEIIRDRKKFGQIYHRLILTMASVQLVSSVFLFLSTWPAPADSGVIWASGTVATCRLQGFFAMLSIIVPCYNFNLAIYYLLIIGYGKRESQLRNTEITMHASVLTFGFATAVIGLALNLYHPTALWCTVAPDPSGVENHYNAFLWAFYGGPLWVIILSVTAIMTWVFVLVRRQERKVRKWRRGSDSAARKLTKQVAWQSFWYSVSFYVTWTFPTISRAILEARGSVPFGVVALHSFLVPSQGLMNFWVYMRPRYVRYKKEHPNFGVCRATGKAVGKTFFFWRDQKLDDARDDMNPALDIGLLNTVNSEAVNPSRFDYLKTTVPNGRSTQSTEMAPPSEPVRAECARIEEECIEEGDEDLA